MSGFLATSSLHGLQYLSAQNTQSKYSRLLWFVCILVSFSLAISITCLNLISWSENPAVVTAVEAVDIEKNALLPVVVLCPSNIGISSFISTYINNINTNKTPKVAKAKEELNIRILQSKLFSAVTSITVNLRYFHTVEVATETMLVQISEACQRDELSFQCQLFTLLYQSSRQKIETKSDLIDVEEKKAIALEVARSVYYQEPLSLEKLKPIMLHNQEYENMTPGFNDSTNWPMYQKRMIYNTYLIFANSEELGRSVRYRGIWPQSHVLASQTPKDGIISPTSPELNFKHLGTFLSLYFNKDFEEIEHELEKLIAAYLGNGLDFPLFKYFSFFDTNLSDEHHTPDCVNNSTSFKTFKSFCQHSQDCQDYCRFIQKSNENPGDIFNIMSSAYPSTDEANAMEPVRYFPLCRYQEGNITKVCAEKVITERGLCYAVNKPQWNHSSKTFNRERPFVHKSGNWMQIFYDTFNLGSKEKEVPRFLTYLSDSLNVVQVSSDAKVFKADRTSHVPLNARISSSTEGTMTFKSMPSSRRKCLYPHEMKLQYFDFYSDANCFLECLWDHASVECECVPWYIHNLYPGNKICERIGLSCFSKILEHKRLDENTRYEHTDVEKNQVWLQECSQKCLPNCEKVNYEIISKEARAYGFTSDDYALFQNNYDKHFQEEILDTHLVNNTQYMNNGKDEENRFPWTEKTVISGPMILEINFEKGMMRIIKTATITTINMISNIGGTLGLFSGFSILSAIEIIYWACIYLTKPKGG